VKYYKVVQYLSTFTKKSKIGLILGIPNLQTIFDTQYYDNLKGGIFEAFGVGFGNNVKMYVYPVLENGKLVNTDGFPIDEKLKGLLTYLKDNNKLQDIMDADTSVMHIFSDDVLDMIKKGEAGWEKLVPEQVANSIKEMELFEYRPELV
jgi:hypothetical protein